MDRGRFCRPAYSLLEIALRAELKTFRHLQPVASHARQTRCQTHCDGGNERCPTGLGF